MIFKSEHMTQASGSIAGVTYGRAKGGVLYRRARAIPVNPATMFQGQVRDAMTDLVTRWGTVLTQAQRDAWDLYGQNVLVTNKLGTPVPLSGQNWYIAANTPRIQQAMKVTGASPTVDVAPSIFDRGAFTTPGTTTLGVAAGLSMPYTDTDTWASEDDSVMLIYMGRPRNPARAYFSGPYRLIYGVEGSSVSPPTSPIVRTTGQVETHGFELIEGQRVTLQVAVSRADGRLSTRRTIFDGLVVA